MSKRTIEIDCPPGHPRPGDLIDGVLEGTGLEAGDTVARVFGNWVWAFEADDASWEAVQAIVAPRLEALYHQGVIRYASW
jgi:hypothetical protein